MGRRVKPLKLNSAKDWRSQWIEYISKLTDADKAKVIKERTEMSAEQFNTQYPLSIDEVFKSNPPAQLPA